jgi:hypothetical protein
MAPNQVFSLTRRLLTSTYFNIQRTVMLSKIGDFLFQLKEKNQVSCNPITTGQDAFVCTKAHPAISQLSRTFIQHER